MAASILSVDVRKCPHFAGIKCLRSFLNSTELHSGVWRTFYPVSTPALLKDKGSSMSAMGYVVEGKDDKHPVQHLISNDVCKKWLCNPQDRTGVMEAIVQLENLCIISYVNVGSIWCATLEVKVGRSDWPAGREFETLIYAVRLMSPGDCTMGKNPIKTEMYTTDSFCADTAKQEWDRIKVICRQPYRKTNQFGLSFLHIKSAMPTVPSYIASTSRIRVESSVTQGSNASVSSIKQHFLGKINNGAKKSDKELKSKLLKIAASSEGGAEIPTDGALSRTAKLVLAAAKGPLKAGSPRTKTPDSVQRGLYSNHLDQKYGPQFEDEVKVFLSKLTVNPSDLDNVTLADIRHRFERKIKRKLTKEEKKKFAELTTEALSSLFEDKAVTSVERNKYLKSENTTPRNGLKNVKNDSDISWSVIDGKSTPNSKTSKTAIEVVNGKVTPVGKRKLESCDDIVTPPSKKRLPEESSSIKQKMKSVEKKPGALKVKNRVNEILHNKQLNIENTINSVQKTKPNKINELDMPDELLCGKMDCYKDLKPMHKNVKKDRSFSNGMKKTPLKESSFGEFLLNITMSDCDDDDDDDDDDILFPEQKIPKHGRGRGRGKRKQSSKDVLVSNSDNPQTPVGRGQGNQQKGRGRGRKTKKQESPSVSSSESKPIGFAKCDGCEDYFGAQFLSVHQGKCVSWKSKQSSSDTSNSPWLCASPAPSTKTNPTDRDQKSPPWVMAALAAERRMNQRKEGTQCSNNTETDIPFSINTLGSISTDERGNHHGQRKHSEKNSRQMEQSAPSFSSENHLENRNISVSRNVSNNQSKNQKCFDLTLGGSDSRDSFTGGSESDSRDSFTDINNFVACPLCGDLLPKSVIEMHASNCGL